jgi:hypothetical protein
VTKTLRNVAIKRASISNNLEAVEKYEPELLRAFSPRCATTAYLTDRTATSTDTNGKTDNRA